MPSQFYKDGVRVSADALPFNKWPGERFRSKKKHSIAYDVTSLAQLRDIKVDLPALRGRRQIGLVIRHLDCMYVHNLEGGMIGVPGAAMRTEHGHHVGEGHHYYGVPPAVA